MSSRLFEACRGPLPSRPPSIFPKAASNLETRSAPQSEVELTHIDLNDNTLEGLRHRNFPLFSVQYHPEAAPGPHDSHYLFKDFVGLMEEFKR